MPKTASGRAFWGFARIALPVAVLTIFPLTDGCGPSKQGEKTFVMQSNRTLAQRDSLAEKDRLDMSKKENKPAAGTVFLPKSEGRQIVQIDSATLQKLREAFIDEVIKIRQEPKNRKEATARGQKKPKNPYLQPVMGKVAQDYADLLATAPPETFESVSKAHNYKIPFDQRVDKVYGAAYGMNEAISTSIVESILEPSARNFEELEKIVRHSAHKLRESKYGHALIILQKDRNDFPAGVGISAWKEFDKGEGTWTYKTVLVYDAGHTELVGKR